MNIEFATEADIDYISERDKHLARTLIPTKIMAGEIYILRDSNQAIGWMRFNYFWDNTPFMNLIWIDEPYRGQGLGKDVVLHWEEQMKERGFQVVMTSTQSNEEAQHFYRKLGYVDVGCLLQEKDPLEILLSKKL
ncbi:GNAT family N-acetyltransferase [Paenibacillus sp. DXFW5]|uniref:GNAT family N-acetyltransferase n=1 Tax=Paenibacillus rhizolycopersici TaxID=2780073 RepID=A0ABS2H6X0_9BACL|nr:GNAT family N-acetyltransferase [Paenibacillus rhizolycopersici]